MPITTFVALLAAFGPDSATAQPTTGRITIPASVGAQPIMIMSRDAARGVTRSVTAINGSYSLPGASGAITATSLDGRWTATGAAPGASLTLAPAPAPARRAASAAWIAKMPAGETRRRFVLDCTGCHQFDDSRAMKDGAPRKPAVWRDDVTRMLQYAGPRSNFPVISAWAEEASVPAWLGAGVASGTPAASASVPIADAIVTEYDTPIAVDLPHDVAVDSAGAIVVTGMQSHVMFKLDVASARFEKIDIPLERANPRAVELDRAGNWWVLFGSPGKIGQYDVRQKKWTLHTIGMYPHSITVARDGKVWYNGHFTRDPEVMGFIDPTDGKVTTIEMPMHPTMGKQPGGPIPYEQREGPDGKIWVSELQGNRMIGYDPKTKRFEVHTLPTSWSGPRRFDVGSDGIIWIPAYSANLLVRLDPRTGKFTEFPMPVEGATPYIARVDRDGIVWIGTSAADAAFRFDPKTARFTMIPLPTQGSLVRHLTIDPKNGDVWLAYGASPARVPSRIARIQLRSKPS